MSAYTSTKAWRDCTKAQLLEGLEMVIEQRDKQILRADRNAERAHLAEARLSQVEALLDAYGEEVPGGTAEFLVNQIRASLTSVTSPVVGTEAMP